MQSDANLDQLRHQAKDLVRAARKGDPSALRRIRAVGTAPSLAAAQLAIARENGFASWPRLEAELKRQQAERADELDDDDWADDMDLPGFRGWTDQGTPIQEI